MYDFNALRDHPVRLMELLGAFMLEWCGHSPSVATTYSMALSGVQMPTPLRYFYQVAEQAHRGQNAALSRCGLNGITQRTRIGTKTRATRNGNN